MKNNFFERLRARKIGSDRYDAARQIIDDVLNEAIKTETYIPRGGLEPQAEYDRRLAITPLFLQTSDVLKSRIGAIFRDEMPLKASQQLNTWADTAGSRNETFESVMKNAASLIQMHGFTLALLDRSAPAQSPSVCLYAAENVLDWQYDANGNLDYVKLVEAHTTRATWQSHAREQLHFRIVTASSITLIVLEKQGEEYSTLKNETVPHGFKSIPVIFCHAFPDVEGIGRPILRRVAESDIAATRTLSDLVWDLFIVGNPILTYTTNKRIEELNALAMSASRYIPLAAGKPGLTADEKLEFVQLDPTGIDALFRAHELFVAQGQIENENGGNSASTAPASRSGISIAWEFKTGEERILFMLSRALEEFANKILALVCADLSDTPIATVTFPTSFDGMTDGTQRSTKNTGV